MVLVFHDFQYQITFDRTRGDLTANIPKVSQFMTNLGGSGALRILHSGSQLVMDIDLRGAQVMLNYAVQSCSR